MARVEMEYLFPQIDREKFIIHIFISCKISRMEKFFRVALFFSFLLTLEKMLLWISYGETQWLFYLKQFRNFGGKELERNNSRVWIKVILDYWYFLLVDPLIKKKKNLILGLLLDIWQAQYCINLKRIVPISSGPSGVCEREVSILKKKKIGDEGFELQVSLLETIRCQLN